MDGYIDEWMGRWLVGWMDGRTDGWIDGSMDGYTDGCMYAYDTAYLKRFVSYIWSSVFVVVSMNVDN